MEKRDIYQVDLIEWIESKWGNDVMIPVYGTQSNKIINSYLIPMENAMHELEDITCPNHCLKPGFDKCAEEGNQYTRFCNYDGIEPFIISQDYEGVFEDYVEVVEEFRLLFNLHYDDSESCYIDPKNMDVVATIKGNEFAYVKNIYLRRYLAVKKMAMIMQLNHQVLFPIETEDWKSECYGDNKEDFRYELNIGSYCGKNFTLLNAKKIIYGCRLEDCGIWPYDKPKKYIKFIVGIDCDGSEREFTCDPSKLNNMANANPESPHYLTPVYFEKNVLDKYYHEDKTYKVEDGVVRCCNQWSLYIDNNNVDKGYVSAYLGDLGRDLPSEKEMYHWRSYNKSMDATLSKAKFKRDFLAEFTDPDSVDLIFKSKYIKVNRLFEHKKGWKLFLDLDTKDSYNFNGIRIPSNNSNSQFDMLVLSLVKILIDSINEKEIKNELKKQNIDLDKLKGSISLIEKWLEACGYENYKAHIKFLRNLQDLRSSGTGHRKGKNYKKICDAFDISGTNYGKVYGDILKQSISLLDFIKATVLGVPENDDVEVSSDENQTERTAKHH